MEELKEKKESTDLIVVKQKNNFKKENKALKIFTNIIYAIVKLIFKLTVIVVIYTVIFSFVAYKSNKYVVEKLRESESNRKVDPVLEELRKDKNNTQNDNKTKENKTKNEKKENETKDNKKKAKNETSNNSSKK